ncbi:hypothetical protein CHUAL_013943 [Chamberlinius hualienensis]
MALLYRFVKINDRCNTQVFTFIITKTVTRDFHRDITSKDFTYNYQKWAVTFSRSDKYLSLFLAWRNPCVGMKCYVDFIFSIQNRDHFSLNEVFSAKQCRFTVDQTMNGNRKFISLSDLHVRNFTDENGEFLLEVTLSNVRNIFESDIRVPHPLPPPSTAVAHGAKPFKLETNYFIFGNFEWNVTILPQSPESGGGRENRLLIYLSRLTGFDYQCRMRYRIILGEGDRRVDSGNIEDFSDNEGRATYGWPLKCHLSELSRRGLIRVHLEIFSANTVSEVKLSTTSVVGATAHCYDREKQAWSIETDVNTEFLRLKIVYKDLYNVPRNHLRYVSWSAHVLQRNPKTGIREPVTVLNAPLGKYYFQEDSDEGVIMETGIPMREINDPSYRFVETNNLIVIQVEWIESLMLFQATYHKYDDTARVQNYQMKREINSLQAENYSLERQLFSYQKSLAYANSRGQPYSDGISIADGYAHNHIHPSCYGDHSPSETD